MAEAGKTLTGRAECLLPGGEVVVRGPEGVFLVANAVPGDEVRFLERERRRGSRRGVLIDVPGPSSLRVTPACTVAAECGGCALQFLDSAAQAGIKSDWVHESFQPFIQSNTSWQPAGKDMPGLRRRRARWWRAEGGQGAYLGFRARASHRVIRHESCPAVLPEMDAVRKKIQTILPTDVQSVRITALYDGMHVVLESGKEADLRAAMPDIPGVCAQYWWRSPSGMWPLSKPVRPLHDCLPAGGREVLLCVGPDDFVQGQAEGNARIVRQVQAWAGNSRRVVDLFAGAGNLSLPLARATGARISGADCRPQSVASANANARRLGVDADFYVADLFGTYDMSAFAGADMLILDPPRKGARQVCRTMGMLLPKRIIMLSCDVASGSRDASILHAHGYRLQEFRAFDLFPFAGHVEAMSLWVQA